MLDELRIASLGVIDDASLELGPGLNVVTGETGAGKTMVVTALGLLLGARADAAMVRQGAARSRVEGRLVLDPDHAVALRAVDAGAELDDDALIVSRTVSAEGRSRARAGGAAVPAGTLAELTGELVVVHGQSDQQQLLLPSRQRECLDLYGGQAVASAYTRYQEVYDRLGRVSAELDEVSTQARERAQEADLLRFGLSEVEAADPQPAEDVDLLAEESRLAHTDGLLRAADEARLALSGDESAGEGVDALALVAAARKALEAEAEHDPRLAELAEQLASASYALAEAAADVSSYAASLETDPQRLAWVQERRAVLNQLTRKYGDTVDDVLAWSQQAAARLVDLDDDEGRIESLRAARDDLRSELATAADALTQVRRRAADELADRVTAELGGLAMPHSIFSVDLRPLKEPARDGADEVSFLLAGHDGAPPRPIQRGASGGELSRVMLAVEVCLAGSNPTPTMIFDEVDAGVGGKAAVEVGRRLSRLSRSVQVVVVTHLPQVAAFADRHYVVVKSSDGSVTTSGVTALDESGRRSELSRMLAGLEDSDTALAHADELVALAAAERSG